MAVFGLGSNYEGTDMTEKFVKNKVACIGYEPDETPTLYNVFKSIKVGDIVYLKSKSPNSGLKIKAVGIATSTTLKSYKNLGYGIHVNWIVETLPLKDFKDDKYNVRCNTIYEEYNDEIIQFLVSLICKK
ncbi:MAG: hypothetical protein IK117_04195 [Bacteroidales bacterium]|nr:hypothetical protein [Bacteroidales bacterium]